MTYRNVVVMPPPQPGCVPFDRAPAEVGGPVRSIDVPPFSNDRVGSLHYSGRRQIAVTLAQMILDRAAAAQVDDLGLTLLGRRLDPSV